MIFIIYLVGLVATYFLSAIYIGYRTRKCGTDGKADKEVKQVIFWAIVLWFISVPLLTIFFIISGIVGLWQLIAGIE